MIKNRLSVIIPARNEIYLEQTIRNVLDNARGDIEIIVELDGWEPNPPINMNDNRVLFFYRYESIGQRQSINHGVRNCTGEYMMKLDAHCAVDEGFDIKLIADCEHDWTVIPRMYNLDVKTWKPKLIEDTDLAIRKRKLHDYMYIGWNDKNELRTLYYSQKLSNKLHRENLNILIDDTMSCMGCCFFMRVERFWELGGCDEGHGGWGQQGIEVALKAWLSGGSLKVNKKTWFAHWFRASDGGFPYPISGNAVDRARKYSMDLWLNNKWEKQVRQIEWVIQKFNPPSWEGRLGLPEGAWYQEAIINGVQMPTQRTKDTSEGRWNKFIKPLIQPGEGLCFDLGCNAGFYSRKIKDLGYDVIGMEKDPVYYGHARYWEDKEPKGISFLNQDITKTQLSECEIILMANVHYWIKEEDLKILVSELNKNAKKVIIVGRHNFADVHKSKPDFETLKNLFKEWEIEKIIKGKKHYSVLFNKKGIE